MGKIKKSISILAQMKVRRNTQRLLHLTVLRDSGYYANYRIDLAIALTETKIAVWEAFV